MYSPPKKDIPKHLQDCPIHSWRANNGIQLIHREPTLEELERIWANWNEMSVLKQIISDQKSMQLFNMPNEQHYHKLKKTYK